MPTRDRAPRRRLRAVERETASLVDLQEQARVATTEVWDGGLRRQLVRALIDHGLKEQEAIGVARAYERRPQFIPGIPPIEAMAQMRALGKIR